MPFCIKCNLEAVTFIRYNGAHLCAEHFCEFVERRARKEVRKEVDLDGIRQVAVALSGGKDSAVALHILHHILNERRDVQVSAITVDEGIEPYRSITLEKAARFTRELGVQHHIIRFQDEFGMTMDEIASRTADRTPCTYCGVLRRRCMNKVARDIGADVLATGLNLDDTAQSIMMNFTRGDMEKLARLGPHLRVQPGLIPRMQPLRMIPEKESLLYAMLKAIPFSEAECQYAAAALRNEYRDLIEKLENAHPGTKHAIISSYDSIRPTLMRTFPPASLGECACGEPTSNEVCMSCALLEEVKRMK